MAVTEKFESVSRQFGGCHQIYFTTTYFFTPHYSKFILPFVQGNCEAFDRDRRTKGSQQGIYFKYYEGTHSHEPELHDIRSSAYLL